MVNVIGSSLCSWFPEPERKICKYQFTTERRTTSNDHQSIWNSTFRVRKVLLYKTKTKTINFQFDFTFRVFNWIIFVYLCSFRNYMDSERIIWEFQFCILLPLNYFGTVTAYMLFVYLFAFWTDFIALHQETYNSIRLVQEKDSSSSLRVFIGIYIYYTFLLYERLYFDLWIDIQYTKHTFSDEQWVKMSTENHI